MTVSLKNFQDIYHRLSSLPSAESAPLQKALFQSLPPLYRELNINIPKMLGSDVYLNQAHAVCRDQAFPDHPGIREGLKSRARRYSEVAEKVFQSIAQSQSVAAIKPELSFLLHAHNEFADPFAREYLRVNAVSRTKVEYPKTLTLYLETVFKDFHEHQAAQAADMSFYTRLPVLVVESIIQKIPPKVAPNRTQTLNNRQIAICDQFFTPTPSSGVAPAWVPELYRHTWSKLERIQESYCRLDDTEKQQIHRKLLGKPQEMSGPANSVYKEMYSIYSSLNKTETNAVLQTVCLEMGKVEPLLRAIATPVINSDLEAARALSQAYLSQNFTRSDLPEKIMFEEFATPLQEMREHRSYHGMDELCASMARDPRVIPWLRLIQLEKG